MSLYYRTLLMTNVNDGVYYVNLIITYANSQGWTIPSTGTINAMIVLVDSMLLSGIWNKLDIFYMFGYNNTSLKNFARINWKSPGDFNITYPTGDCDYNTGGFFKGDDGTTNNVYGLDTNFISSTNGVNYTLNSASIGFYGYNNAGSILNTFTLIVDNSASLLVRIVFGPKTSSLIPTYSINGGISNASFLLSNTLKTINRTSSSSTNFYNSGALIETDASTSTSLSNTSMLLLRNTGNVRFNYSSLFWMGSLLDSTENSNINTYINTFRTSVGL